MKKSELSPAWVRALASGREPLWTPVACGLFTLVGWLGPQLVGLPTALELLAFAAAYLSGGLFSTVRSLHSLAQRKLDIDLLMLLSATGAALIGEFEEGALLLFLFSLSNALESRALSRTTRAIESLMELRPDTAQLLEDGQERQVAVEALQVGALVRVRPGERIPVDGEIVAGHSAADQAAITGESVPVTKDPGDPVWAGSINVDGTVEIRMTKAAEESTLARIIHLVEEAREAKAPTQRFIDRFEQGYTATVLVATAAAIGLPLLFSQPFHSTFYRAMTLLVVASPCAVIISTPATILAALAHAARRGLLFKGGSPLEELAMVEVVAFDKTGTLTRGRPAVTEVVPFGDGESGPLLAMAAAVERLSEHHLGEAIVKAAEAGGGVISEALELRNTRGQGVEARIDGRPVAVGRPGFVSRFDGPAATAEQAQRVAELQAEGRTVVFVQGLGLAGAIAIEDELRPEAPAALAELRRLGVSSTLLLTGDNEPVAARVAAQVGIDSFQADLMPEDKVTALRALVAAGRSVVMVGDGVNDAPALAVANVGVAMGVAGTDAALETADLVLVRDDLALLPYALRLARRARRVVRQNLAFACSVIAVLVVANLVQGIPLPLGVLGHEGSTILVVLNGLRLLRPLRTPHRKRSTNRAGAATP
jgi:Cd2+/Zn2+-exporting ATPase